MKKLLPFIPLFFVIYFTSCQREVSEPEVSNGTGDSLTGNLLVRSVSQWSDGTTPAADSIVTEYTYNDSGRLVKKEVTGQQPVHYNRDAQQRIKSIVSLVSASDTVYTKVFYTGPTSTQVAYLIDGRTSTGLGDSVVYTYAGGHVQFVYLYVYNSGSVHFSGFQKWEFDAQGNATRLDNYTSDSTFNIGYTFEYDTKANPYYSADDARLPTEWGYTCSPNNIIKQNNEYSGGMPADYVTYTYLYNGNNSPVTGQHTGPAIGSQTEALRFYYR